MGLLIDGEWHTDWYDTEKSGGRFVRLDTARSTVSVRKPATIIRNRCGETSTPSTPGFTAIGPEIDFSAPHDRDRFVVADHRDHRV